MPLNSKFFLESAGKIIVKFGQYFAKIRAKYNSLFLWAILYTN